MTVPVTFFDFDFKYFWVLFVKLLVEIPLIAIRSCWISYILTVNYDKQTREKRTSYFSTGDLKLFAIAG
jgi:hypothetical protein